MNDGFEISTDRKRLELPTIHEFLSQTYWARDRTLEQVAVSIENSVPFGAYADGGQIGFARVLTDYVAIAYMLDVFVLPSHRNKGFGSKLVGHILAFPDFSNVGKWLLRTRDAQTLYERHGFVWVDGPAGLMEFMPPKSSDRR